MENIQLDRKAERHQKFESEIHAIFFFHQLINRMLTVNEWDVYTDHHTHFTLTNEQGVEDGDLANVNYFIKSIIPGPPNPNSGGGDWVKITRLDLPNLASDSFLMQLNPSPAPHTNDDRTAHFYSDSSVVQLRAQLNHNSVTSFVETNNLSPNVGKEAGVLQSIRNTGVALAGKLGMSAIHWNDLLDGLWDSINSQAK